MVRCYIADMHINISFLAPFFLGTYAYPGKGVTRVELEKREGR